MKNLFIAVLLLACGRSSEVDTYNPYENPELFGPPTVQQYNQHQVSSVPKMVKFYGNTKTVAVVYPEWCYMDNISEEYFNLSLTEQPPICW